MTVAFQHSTQFCITIVDALCHLYFCTIFSLNLNIQTQGLHFFQKYLEGFRNAWLRDILAFDDSLVCLNTANYVVRLNSHDLLQGVGSTICLQSPNLHLSETLSAELSFTTQRLLCNQGVRTGRTCMDLIIYQMMQFQVMHVSDGYCAVEVFAGTSITKTYFTITADRYAFPELSVL